MAVATGLSFYVNGYNLACALKSFSPQAEVEVIDSTTLCRTSRTFTQGFKNGTLSAEGIWEYDQTNADKIHNIFLSALTADTNHIITASLEALAVGGSAFLMNAIESNYSIDTPYGQLIMCSATFQANSVIDFGKWMFSATVNNTTTNGTSNDGTASSTRGGVLHVHYQKGTATSASAKLQHSSDNSTWADVGSSITLTGDYDADSVVIASGTTINRYTRVVCTAGGGTATFQAAFARR